MTETRRTIHEWMEGAGQGDESARRELLERHIATSSGGWSLLISTGD